MKHQLKYFLAGFIIFATALGLAEIFPGLRPYLPTYDRLVASLKAEFLGVDTLRKTANASGPQGVVLALSWTAAFCETAPHKRECKTQNTDRYDATNFALHGLWPEGQFCTKTPYRNVSNKLWKAMQKAMPGTASGLHKHEWRKHGTCYADTPDRYFTDSLRLVTAFNKTGVRDLFEDKIGKHLTARDIRSAFDDAFGKGAGERVLVHCVRDEGRKLIQELRIRLNGDIGSASLAVLLKQARHQKQGCKGGIIDAVGLQ